MSSSERKMRPSETYEEALYEISTIRRDYSQACLRTLAQTFEYENKLLTQEVNTKKTVPQLPEIENEILDFDWKAPDNFTDRIANLNKRMDNLLNVLEVVKKSDLLILKEKVKQKVSMELEEK